MILAYLLGLLPAGVVCFFFAAALSALSHSSKEETNKLLFIAALCTVGWPITLMLAFIIAITFIFGPKVDKVIGLLILGKTLYKEMQDKMAKDIARMDEIDREMMFNDKLTDFELDELEAEYDELREKDSDAYFREFWEKKNAKQEN